MFGHTDEDGENDPILPPAAAAAAQPEFLCEGQVVWRPNTAVTRVRVQ